MSWIELSDLVCEQPASSDNDAVIGQKLFDCGRAALAAGDRPGARRYLNRLQQFEKSTERYRGGAELEALIYPKSWAETHPYEFIWGAIAIGGIATIGGLILLIRRS